VRKESNFQIVPQLGGGLAANVAIFLQSLVDDPFQFGWYVGIQPNWSWARSKIALKITPKCRLETARYQCTSRKNGLRTIVPARRMVSKS
jgi:hypothetical protein